MSSSGAAWCHHREQDDVIIGSRMMSSSGAEWCHHREQNDVIIIGSRMMRTSSSIFLLVWAAVGTFLRFIHASGSCSVLSVLDHLLQLSGLLSEVFFSLWKLRCSAEMIQMLVYQRFNFTAHKDHSAEFCCFSSITLTQRAPPAPPIPWTQWRCCW